MLAIRRSYQGSPLRPMTPLSDEISPAWKGRWTWIVSAITQPALFVWPLCQGISWSRSASFARLSHSWVAA